MRDRGTEREREREREREHRQASEHEQERSHDRKRLQLDSLCLLVQQPAGMGPPEAIFGGVDIVGRVLSKLVTLYGHSE